MGEVDSFLQWLLHTPLSWSEGVKYVNTELCGPRHMGRGYGDCTDTCGFEKGSECQSDEGTMWDHKEPCQVEKEPRGTLERVT